MSYTAMQKLALLSNYASGDGSGTPQRFQGGKAQHAVVASSFDGGTVTLEGLGPDGSTYVEIATGLTANGVQTVDIPPGQYRATVSGTSTATAALYSTLIGIPD